MLCLQDLMRGSQHYLQALWLALVVNDKCVLRAQIGGVKHAATVRNQRHLFLHRCGVVRDSGRLYLRIQAFLQLWVMSGDARWTGILIALQRLNTTQREHEPTR